MDRIMSIRTQGEQSPTPIGATANNVLFNDGTSLAELKGQYDSQFEEIKRKIADKVNQNEYSQSYNTIINNSSQIDDKAEQLISLFNATNSFANGVDVNSVYWPDGFSTANPVNLRQILGDLVNLPYGASNLRECLDRINLNISPDKIKAISSVERPFSAIQMFTPNFTIGKEFLNGYINGENILEAEDLHWGCVPKSDNTRAATEDFYEIPPQTTLTFYYKKDEDNSTQQSEEYYKIFVLETSKPMEGLDVDFYADKWVQISNNKSWNYTDSKGIKYKVFNFTPHQSTTKYLRFMVRKGSAGTDELVSTDVSDVLKFSYVVSSSNFPYITPQMYKMESEPTWDNAFSRAISEAHLSKKIIFIPEGEYQLAAPIKINYNGITMIGAGYNTIIHPPTPFNKNTIANHRFREDGSVDYSQGKTVTQYYESDALKYNYAIEVGPTTGVTIANLRILGQYQKEVERTERTKWTVDKMQVGEDNVDFASIVFKEEIKDENGNVIEENVKRVEKENIVTITDPDEKNRLLQKIENDMANSSYNLKGLNKQVVILGSPGCGIKTAKSISTMSRNIYSHIWIQGCIIGITHQAIGNMFSHIIIHGLEEYTGQRRKWKNWFNALARIYYPNAQQEFIPKALLENVPYDYDKYDKKHYSVGILSIGTDSFWSDCIVTAQHIGIYNYAGGYFTNIKTITSHYGWVVGHQRTNVKDENGNNVYSSTPKTYDNGKSVYILTYTKNNEKKEIYLEKSEEADNIYYYHNEVIMGENINTIQETINGTEKTYVLIKDGISEELPSNAKLSQPYMEKYQYTLGGQLYTIAPSYISAENRENPRYWFPTASKICTSLEMSNCYIQEHKGSCLILNNASNCYIQTYCEAAGDSFFGAHMGHQDHTKDDINAYPISEVVIRGLSYSQLDVTTKLKSSGGYERYLLYNAASRTGYNKINMICSPPASDLTHSFELIGGSVNGLFGSQVRINTLTLAELGYLDTEKIAKDFWFNNSLNCHIVPIENERICNRIVIQNPKLNDFIAIPLDECETFGGRFFVSSKSFSEGLRMKCVLGIEVDGEVRLVERDENSQMIFSNNDMTEDPTQSGEIETSENQINIKSSNYIELFGTDLSTVHFHDYMGIYFAKRFINIPRKYCICLVITELPEEISSVNFDIIHCYYGATLSSSYKRNNLLKIWDGESPLRKNTLINSSQVKLNSEKTAHMQNYRIYGNSNGLGQLIENGSYIIPIAVKKQINIFNKYFTPNENIQIINGVPCLSTSVLANGKKTVVIGTFNASWFAQNKTYEFSTNANLDNKNFRLKLREINNVKIFVYNSNKEALETSTSYQSTFFSDGEAKYFKKIATSNEDLNVEIDIPKSGRASELIEFQKTPIIGKIATDEISVHTISLNSPLLQNEFIDYATQTVYRANGSIEEISLPGICLSEGENEISIQTAETPDKIEFFGYIDKI